MNRPVRGRVFVGIAAAFLAVAMLEGSSIASGAPLRPLAVASATPQPRTDAPVHDAGHHVTEIMYRMATGIFTTIDELLLAVYPFSPMHEALSA